MDLKRLKTSLAGGKPGQEAARSLSAQAKAGRFGQNAGDSAGLC